MEAALIIEVLKKWNLWEKKIDTGIKREEYVNKIYSFMGRKEILVLKGIRRAGKSTIMKELMAELVRKGIGKKSILYLNLEDYNFSGSLKIPLFEEVLAAYRNYAMNKGKVYFFIDEVQKIPDWEKWIRTKYDLGENIKFIISGSSASLLSKELSTLLTGRNISFKIMPLSFKEFLIFNEKGKMDEYLMYGGFPEVVLEKSEDKKATLLRQYFEDIIHKDIIDRYNIRNPKQLMDIAKYLVSNAGAKVSINKLGKVFGLSKDTISAYTGYMIDAFLLLEVTAFSYSAKIKHDVSKLPKLYVMDNGLINVVNVKYAKERWRLYENAVLVKLASGFDEVSYWADTGSEVDFIAGSRAINVTATDKIPDREFRGLEEFGKKHRQFTHTIVTEASTKGIMVSITDFLKE